MLYETKAQFAAVVALPIVTILLVWTSAIFQRNRKSWGPYDIPIVTLLILSILRNLTVLTYTLFVALSQDAINHDYCSALVWIFNSIHTFQASSLTTLAVIGLFSVKLHRKQQHLRQFLTATHVIYHLFCLTTLCACVGVAAILAQPEPPFFRAWASNPCLFMPFELDLKYNVFIIVLNVFLASVSVIAFMATCFNHFKIKKHGFDYLKKSNSDLSDLSLGNEQKNYYDTYTIQRGDHHLYDGQNQVAWNSDVSNISTTVSSTNSRRPCITQQPVKNDEHRTGLETIHPVLIVCYLFYHLPLIILCIYPGLVDPWDVAGVALWLGLVQDVLIPTGLGIVDSRFCKWVSNVYKCSNNRGGDKLPHVGLDGKFRPFSSPPQSLEVAQNQRVMQTIEHRFPITNGSLYTSIDGRLPVIHNYRRHKDQRGVKTEFSHVRPEQAYQRHNLEYSCRSCEADLCPSHSNLHHLSPQYINKQLNLIQNKNPLTKRTSLSQESLRYIPETHFYQEQIKNSRNLVRLNKMRLCKSEDSLNDVTRELKFKATPDRVEYSSSDEEYLPENRNFDTLSSQSSYSITTEANCDFEFFQNNKERVVFENKVARPKIQRSSSYMTLEDRNKKRNKKLLRSNSKLSDCTHNIRNKVKSVEYLPNSNASTVFIEDVFYFNYPNQRKWGERNYVGSVPDLKKVFISEYI
ncbi:uncharacterized protein LOC100141756 [Tribolium castaneum]|uniref:uncharacterized protein LOC100141756 n=1 Tax=Tribolium castaneum TaxID=7070 RepID=UPI0030FED99F